MGHFTESTGRLHLGMGCYCRGRFFQARSFMGFTSPLFSQFASCDWWRVRFLLVPFSPCGPLLLGCLLAAWTSVLAPCFLFLPLGCFLSIKFGGVSSILVTRVAPVFHNIQWQCGGRDRPSLM